MGYMFDGKEGVHSLKNISKIESLYTVYACLSPIKPICARATTGVKGYPSAVDMVSYSH